MSDNGEGYLYILYEESKNTYIGSIDITKKVLNDFIEDTAEIFIIVMKSIIAHLEGKYSFKQ